MDSDWEEFVCKAGQTLYMYNKKTGERRWPVRYEKLCPNTMVTRHEVIIKKEMSNVATQTDDSGCVHGCTSMYVSPLGNFNVSNSNSYFNLHLDSYNDELAENEVPFMSNADKERESKLKSNQGLSTLSEVVKEIVSKLDQGTFGSKDDKSLLSEELEAKSKVVCPLSTDKNREVVSYLENCLSLEDPGDVTVETSNSWVIDHNYCHPNSQNFQSSERPHHNSLERETSSPSDSRISHRSNIERLFGGEAPCTFSRNIVKRETIDLLCKSKNDGCLSIPKHFEIINKAPGISCSNKNETDYSTFIPSNDISFEDEPNSQKSSDEENLTSCASSLLPSNDVSLKDKTLSVAYSESQKSSNAENLDSSEVSCSSNVALTEEVAFCGANNEDLPSSKESCFSNNISVSDEATISGANNEDLSSSKESGFSNNISVSEEVTISGANNEDLSSSKESGFFNNISVGKEATISGANNEDLSSSKESGFSNNKSVTEEATISRANNEDLSSSKESGFSNNISFSEEATISGANNEDLSLSRDSSNDVEGETIKTNSDSFISSGKAASNPSSDNTMDRETTIVTSQSSSQRRITLSARVLLRPLIILPEINSKEHKPTLDYEEKAYLCDKCPKAFDKRSTLLRHILVHTGERPHSCRQCGKSFSDKGNLNQHLKVHSGNKPYKCKHCKRSFSRSPDLTRHLRIHTGQKPYKCEECGKAFTQIGTLKQHGQVHSGKKPFKCQECSKSFTLKSNLVVHQRTHTGEKPFECRRCGNMFSQKVTLREHQRLAHNRKKEFRCSSCRREFSTKRKLTYHHTYHSN